MPNLTTNYSLNKPLVGDAIDEDLWGGYLNDNMDIIDTTMKSISNSTYSNVLSKTANYTVLSTDRNDVITVDATSGNLTISLTSAATLGDGFKVTVKKIDSSSNTVTIDPNSSETIDGVATKVISSQYQSLTIVSNGTNWFVESDATQADTFSSYFLHVRDEKASGTNGGTFTSGSWQTRTLNTTKTNTIPGATLTTNVISLPAGTYYVDAYAPCEDVAKNQARLRNTTAGTTLIVGTSERASSATSQTVKSVVTGRFTLSATSNIELQHYSQNTASNTGFGEAANTGEVEVYSEVRIWKLS